VKVAKLSNEAPKAPKLAQSWFFLMFPRIEIVPIAVEVTLCFQWDSFDGERERFMEGERMYTFGDSKVEKPKEV